MNNILEKNKKLIILFVILTPLFLYSALDISHFIHPGTLIQFFWGSPYQDKFENNPFPPRQMKWAFVELNYNSKNGTEFVPSNPVVFLGVNNTISFTNNLNDNQQINFEDHQLYMRTLNTGGIDVIQLPNTGEYEFSLKSNPETLGKITVLPSIFSQTFHDSNASGRIYNDWKKPGEENLRAFSSVSNGAKQDWSNFYTHVPDNLEISGIEVAVLGSIFVSGFTSAGVNVELIWDGENYTDSGHKLLWDQSQNKVVNLGGPGDLWGHNWTAEQLKRENFGVRLEKIGDEDTIVYVERVAVKVYLEK